MFGAEPETALSVDGHASVDIAGCRHERRGDPSGLALWARCEWLRHRSGHSDEFLLIHTA